MYPVLGVYHSSLTQQKTNLIFFAQLSLQRPWNVGCMQSLPLDLWTAGLLIWGWLFSATASWMAMKWLQVYGTFSSYCFAMGILAWLHRWKIRGKFLSLQKLCGGWLFHDPSVLKIISRVLLSLMVMLICIHCSVQTRTFILLSSFLKSQIIYFYQIKIQ